MPGPIWDALASEARGAVHLSELVVIFVYHFGFNIDLSKRSLCASFFLFLICCFAFIPRIFILIFVLFYFNLLSAFHFYFFFLMKSHILIISKKEYIVKQPNSKNK